MQHDSNLADFQLTEELAPGGTLLYGQYTIERHLIDGGFGMTYLARDSLDRRVVIKECFPGSLCRRIAGEVRPRKPEFQEQFQGVIRNFLREALRLSKFEHINIVKVHQVFQENNTAYISMDYVDGMDLLSMLDLDPGRLSDGLIQKLLRDTLGALDHVHGFGMLHRDISPDNLLLDEQDHLTLIDFGAARENLRRETRALSVVMAVKDGYSPHEFYYTDGAQDPASDIYSVGATFYHLITGSAPPDSQRRIAALTSDEPDPYKPLADGNWSFDPEFLRAIDKAMSVSQKDRFQSASDWLEVLSGCAGPSERVEFDVPATPADPEPAAARTVTRARHADLEIEPQLAKVISTLVQTTNTDIDPLTYQKAQARAAEEAAEKKKRETTNRLFDIFGNPIDDVDQWLREQDKQARRDAPSKAAKAAPKAASMVSDSAPDTQDNSGFGLSRVFSKFSKRRRAAELARN